MKVKGEFEFPVDVFEGEIFSVRYSIEYFEGGSEYGINGGCITYLSMRWADNDEQFLLYDREWELEPLDPIADDALKWALVRFG